jgi:hypothetical protein
MNAYELLRKVLPLINQAPAEITGNDLRARLPDDDIPSPWVTWTLILSICQAARQRWAAEVVRDRLGVDPEKLADHDVQGHPTYQPNEGGVPGLPEWEYHFHGRTCYLRNPLTGEVIYLDDRGPDRDQVLPGRLRMYLRQVPQPAAPKRRLRELGPSTGNVGPAVAELWKTGVLTRPCGHWFGFFLASETRELVPLVDQFARAWEDPAQRLWLGPLIGDWMAAHEAALARGREDLLAVTAQQAALCRERRLAELQRFLDTDCDHYDEFLVEEILEALHELGAVKELKGPLEKVLQDPDSPNTATALEIVTKLADAAWCPQVEALWKRLDQDDDGREPSLWTGCVDFLLKHNYHTAEIVTALPRAGWDQIAAAALHALERAPEHALALLRRALRAYQPDRIKAAAVLALIDQPWSRRELLAVLDESGDQEATAECRAALLETHDLDAQRAVEAWEVTHPAKKVRRSKKGKANTSDGLLKCVPADVRDWMDKLRDRVMPLRTVLPPDPGMTCSHHLKAGQRACVCTQLPDGLLAELP